MAPIPVPLVVSSPYGYRIHPLTKKRYFHPGIDIERAAGVPIRSIESGTVVGVRAWNKLDPDHTKTIGGNQICIQGPTGFTWCYLYMRDVPSLRKGARVSAGQVVGVVGNTGRVVGRSHLHIQVYPPGGFGKETLNPIDVVPAGWFVS